MTEQQVLEDYYRVERLLCMDDPFYGLLLMNLRKFVNKIPRQKNKTMCVFLNDTDYCLNISSYFWQALPNDTIKLTMVKHEAMHITFFHFDTGKNLMCQNKHMANEAADLSINCYLKNFPPSITIKDKTRKGEWKDRILNLVYFPNYESKGCEPYKDIFYYFQWLKDHPQENNQQGQNDEDWDDDDGSQSQGSNHDFSGGNSGQEVTDNQIKMANKHLESIMERVKNDVMKSVGKVPAELSDIFDMFGKIEPEKFNWKRYLRLFCAKSKAIWYKKTKRKESKRFQGNAGTKTKHYCKVAVMPDTSGSVSDDELTEFISEFVAMRRQHNDVNIICFDTKVYEPVKLTTNYKVPISGRGGTDFKEAVDWIWENYKDYDCFIIFTDGYDTVPSKLPSNNLLWVLSSKTDLTPENFKAKNCIKLEI